MRLPDGAHTDRPWRIHALAPDFELEDVWTLPTPGGPDDLERLVRQFATPDTRTEQPLLVRVLFALRWQIGRVLGWDRPADGLGGRVTSLRERLPADLRDGPRGPDITAVPAREGEPGAPVFSAVYRTGDEWVAEIANRTVHGLLHLGWVPDEDGAGGYHGQLAVLVKPAGPLGRAYLAAIKPFRLVVVYPLLLRSVGRAWRADAAGATPSSAPRAAAGSRAARAPHARA